MSSAERSRRYRAAHPDRAEASRPRVDVTCKTCGAEWSKRRDSLATWNGQCRRCAQRDRAATELPMRAERAREQVISQGGIPNAQHFTPERVRGEANANWRGGVGIAHYRYHSVEYKAWRRSICERDGWACRECGASEVPLHAHHLKPVKTHPEHVLDLSNGVALCAPCHREVHRRSV